MEVILVLIYSSRTTKTRRLIQAFILAEDFIGSDDVCMILGDNIFHGNGINGLLHNAVKKVKKSKKQQFLVIMLTIQLVMGF